MPKKIVILCDGTGNEVGVTITNVLKLFRVLEKNERQRVFYNPGLGTIGARSAWLKALNNLAVLMGLATGYGLDCDVLWAYRILCAEYEKGDEIWLFGFSRGAYTVRVLAGFIHLMGLLPVDRINLADYALAAYKAAGTTNGDGGKGFERAWAFRRITRGRPVPIRFVGVWDTVSSVMVPRGWTLLPMMQTLPFTRTNPSVETMRQAIAIDERRRMFRLNHWAEPQPYQGNRWDRKTHKEQDVRQVWFAGVHADIGGGYPEDESGLSKFPLAWMIEQAKAAGLRVMTPWVNHLVCGKPRRKTSMRYVPPDQKGRLHRSLRGLWRILEYLPKRKKWQEWPERPSAFGWYLPLGEPRKIGEDARIHHSVLKRIAEVPDYAPVNLPDKRRIEPDGGLCG